jgi:rSAM/selenodomain-associated transferase 2
VDATLMTLSIIIPTLNEAENIEGLLQGLAPFRQRGAEIIVADGGSSDGTAALVAPHADKVIPCPTGRALQMNVGASHSGGDILLFLHADTRLPDDADTLIIEGLASSHRRWGRFDVAIEGKSRLLGVIARMMNWRSRMTGISTGDQAIFVTRALFKQMGGYPEIRLMEDVAFTRTLKRHGKPLALNARVQTSGRRWEKQGVLQTMWLMWRLRFAYWRGVHPDDLAALYVPHER